MLKDEIKNYLDINGYVNPFKANPEQGRQCDNATLYTSEYYIMLAKSEQLTEQDRSCWADKILNSFQKIGLLARYPYDINLDQDSPDNMLGVLAASVTLKYPGIAKVILCYGREHWGWFNNENSDSVYMKDNKTINWSAFLWRQPQLWFASLCAAQENRFYHAPLAFYSAVAILIAGWRTSTQETDSRRLSWLLIQITINRSFLCKLASKVWYNRLYKDYGPTGMRAVASIYYQESHPFAKFWID